jgi:hypothetical protein
MGIVPSETFSHGGDIILLFPTHGLNNFFFTTLKVINIVRVLLC